jgi:polyvinyl alcohol dehydrogenase (cytochrome)
MRYFMRKLHPFAIAAAIFLAGCSAKSGLSEGDLKRAEKLYQENCATCHDTEASGAPNRAALESRTPAALLAALETGLMREQGKALKPEERQLLADYLGVKTTAVTGKKCDGELKLADAPLWNRWGNGLENRRYQPVAKGGITPANVGNLELRWAFAFPNAARARSQPVVTDEAIFTGSSDGRVYALNRESGCIWWTFDADSEVRSAPTLGDDGRLYFGDFSAQVYAVDARSGELVWKTPVKDHPAGTITGSLTLHDGRLFVPMSSTEVISAMKAEYECCSFRGGVTALEAKTGKTLWRMHTVDAAKEAGVDQKGQPAFGPSGAPVWSSPTVDTKRGLLYFGTGENYSSPASAMSDSIIAVELGTGKIRWWQQTIANDAWNASCESFSNGVNCPREKGPDLDFGAPPILMTLADGRDILLAGQKSGMVFALDPDKDGSILWRQRAGAGGYNGGIHWGMASDAAALYVGIADTPGNKGAVGPRRPGIHAFDLISGKPLWSRIEPFTCKERKFECETALSAPVTATDGIVFGGAHNGLLRAYSTADGSILWSFDTRREFQTINGVKGKGGSIDSAGPVLAGGLLIVNSGYDKFGEIPGNVLLVFGQRKGLK